MHPLKQFIFFIFKKSKTIIVCLFFLLRSSNYLNRKYIRRLVKNNLIMKVGQKLFNDGRGGNVL